MMTEKRYYQRDFEELYYIIDSNVISEKEFDEKEMYDGYTAFEDSMTGKEIVDLLNEQHETILSLHKTIEELDNCQKGQSHRINDLYLENKQLKDLITHLGYTIKYDGYRHISLELQE